VAVSSLVTTAPAGEDAGAVVSVGPGAVVGGDDGRVVVVEGDSVVVVVVVVESVGDGSMVGVVSTVVDVVALPVSGSPSSARAGTAGTQTSRHERRGEGHRRPNSSQHQSDLLGCGETATL
jgi:hypothetical protein